MVRDLAETIACEAVCHNSTCLALLPVAMEYSCSRLLAKALQVRDYLCTVGSSRNDVLRRGSKQMLSTKSSFALR